MISDHFIGLDLLSYECNYIVEHGIDKLRPWRILNNNHPCLTIRRTT